MSPKHYLIIHLSSFNQVQHIELNAFIDNSSKSKLSISNRPQMLKTWNSSLKFIDELVNMIDLSENFHFYVIIELAGAKQIDADTYKEMQDKIANSIRTHMPWMNAKNVLHIQFLESELSEALPLYVWWTERRSCILQHVQELENVQ